MKARTLVIGPQTNGQADADADAHGVATLLERRGFAVDLRTGHQTPRQRVLDKDDGLIAWVGPDVPAVVNDAGHGVVAMDPRATTPNRWLPAIVSYDHAASTEGDYRGILAVELAIKLAKLTARTVILDCAFAARMNRDGTASDVRIDTLICTSPGDRRRGARCMPWEAHTYTMATTCRATRAGCPRPRCSRPRATASVLSAKGAYQASDLPLSLSIEPSREAHGDH